MTSCRNALCQQLSFSPSNFFSYPFLYCLLEIAIQKGKYKLFVDITTLPPIINLNEIPLVDTHYKIVETECEFDLYELHNWEYKKI